MFLSLLPFSLHPWRELVAPLYIHLLGQQTLASNTFHLPDPLACLEHCPIHISERYPELANRPSDATHRHAVSLAHPPARSSPVHLPDLRDTLSLREGSALHDLLCTYTSICRQNTYLSPPWLVSSVPLISKHSALDSVHATCTVVRSCGSGLRKSYSFTRQCGFILRA